MARGRMLNKTVSLSLKFHDLPDDTCRLLATWIISQLDYRGVFYADPAVVKSMVFPRRTDITIDDVARYLDAMQEAGLIEVFEVRGELWQSWPGFAHNQIGLRAERERTEYPPPPGWSEPEAPPEDSESPQDGGKLQDDSPQDAAKKPAEGEGKVKVKLSTKEDCAASAAKPSAPPPEPPPKQSKPPTPAQEMFSAVAELCQIDLSLLSKKDRGKINTVSKRLRDEKKSTAHLDQFKRYWYAVDWRGVKGQAPAPHDILSSWGRAKEWLANGGKGKDAKRNDRRAKPVDTGQAAKRQIEAEQSAHVGRVLAERAQAAGLAV